MGKDARAGTRWSWLGVLLCTCASAPEAPGVARATLDPVTFAQLGDRQLATEYVATVAVRRGLGAEEAGHTAISDAVSAIAFARQSPATAHYIRRSWLARRTLDRLREEAQAAGPASNLELEAHTAQHWQELDRPEARRITHFVVMPRGACDRAQAEHRATELAALLGPDLTAAEFRARLDGKDVKPCELRVEDLDPVTADGRQLGPGAGRLVPEFARAAHKLRTVGEHGGVTETQFGYHVLLLTELLPELRVSEGERRAKLQPEIESARAKERLLHLLEAGRNQLHPDVSTDALALTELLQGAE